MDHSSLHLNRTDYFKLRIVYTKCTSLNHSVKVLSSLSRYMTQLLVFLKEPNGFASLDLYSERCEILYCHISLSLESMRFRFSVLNRSEI